MSDQELRDLVASLAVQQRETALQFQEIARQSQETDRRFQETDRQFRETDRKIKELGIQIGGLANKFGSFTESLALPSAERLLMERFGAEAFTAYLRRTMAGEHIEVDGFAFNNGERNEGYIVEVKSRLDARAVEQTVRIIERFRSFFPEFANKTLYGLIAAAEATSEAIALAHSNGLYVMRFNDELMEFIEAENFTARAF